MALTTRSRALSARARADSRRRQLAGARDARGRLDEPFFVARGEGAYLVDVDGNRYLDWVLSWGPLIFGHADPETVEAVREAALRGTSFGAPTEAEVELAAEIADAVPSIEKVRLVSSGTEAAMSALRLARGFTKRDRIIKFAGGYHGHVDALLASAGSGARDARDPVDARRADRRHGRHDRLPVQRRRGGRRGRAPLRRRPRRDHRRAGRREHGRRPAGRRLPRGAAAAVRRVRRAARLRRGDHRLPRRARRRAGALRRRARSDDPRQDRRRRPAARGVRRPRRRDGRRSRRAGRSTRPERSPATRSRPPPASRCCAACATRPSTTSSSARARGSRPGSREFGARAPRRRDADALHDRPRRPQLRGRAGLRHRALRRALPSPARARHLHRAVAVRGDVRLARALGRGHRPHRGGGR